MYVFERGGGTKGFLKLMREVRQDEVRLRLRHAGPAAHGPDDLPRPGRRKVGRTDAREGRRALLRREGAAAPGGPAQPRPRHPAAVLPGARAPSPSCAGPLRFREAENLNLQVRRGPARAPGPFLLFPDSRRPEKRWDGFKQLTEMLLREDRGAQGGLGGQQLRCPTAAPFRAAQFLNLTGNTSLVSLPALIKRADWVITNDSGPMHLAAALGRARARHLRAHRPAALRALSADGADQFRDPGPGGRPESC